MPKAVSNQNKTTSLNDLRDIPSMDEIKDQARQSAHDLRQFAGKINQLAHEFVGIANDEFTDARRKVRTQIKSEPLKAVGIAFAAGFLLRAFTSRG